MPALSEDVLKKLITPNAKALSKPGGVEKAASRQVVDRDPYEYNDFDDSMYLAETYGQPSVDYSSNNFNPDRVKSSKMLSAIKEEMISHPIDTSALQTMKLESANGGNVSENLGRLGAMISGAKAVEAKLAEGPAPQRQQISENRNYGGGGASVDYALIKSIINECLEEKLGNLMGGGTLKTISLNKGKIKLVDNKGNVFSAKLEFEKNIKDGK